MSQRPPDHPEPEQPRRRDLLKFAATGIAFVAWPAWSQAQPAVGRVPADANMALLGYWPASDTFDRLDGVRAGWQSQGSGVAPGKPEALGGGLVAAGERPSGRGLYRLRVVGGESDRPLRARADHGDGALHGIWQVWRDAPGLCASSPLAIRWSAANGEALPIAFDSGASHGARVAVPASRGVYVAILVPPEAALDAFVLHAPDPSCPQALRLHERASGAAARQPYLLLAVDGPLGA